MRTLALYIFFSAWRMSGQTFALPKYTASMTDAQNITISVPSSVQSAVDSGSLAVKSLTPLICTIAIASGTATVTSVMAGDCQVSVQGSFRSTTVAEVVLIKILPAQSLGLIIGTPSAKP